MHSLPESIVSNLRQFGLRPQKIVFENKNKKRYNIIASKNNKTYFVKINAKNTPGEHYKNFKKEINFYKSAGDSKFLPEYIDSESNILILKNVKSLSLRSWTESHLNNTKSDEYVSDEFYNFVSNLKESVEQLYFKSSLIPDSVCEEKPRDVDEAKLFASHIAANCSRLFTSGPMNTSRGRIEQNFGTVLRIPYISAFKKCTHKILLESSYQPKLKPIHSDLHQDNVLVDDAGEVYIVDWESCRYGFWINDVAFLSATIFALLRNFPIHYKLVDDALTEIVMENERKAYDVFDWMRDSMKKAISTNRRFHNDISNQQLIYGFGNVCMQIFSMIQSNIYKRYTI